MVTALKEHGIPEQYLKEKYLSFLDWDAIDKYNIDEKIEKELGETDAKEEGGMGMGY